MALTAREDALYCQAHQQGFWAIVGRHISLQYCVTALGVHLVSCLHGLFSLSFRSDLRLKRPDQEARPRETLKLCML